MTDRIKGFIVTLDKDYRDDDVEAIKQAIEMIKGVVSVENSITTFDDEMNRSRIKSELRSKFYKFINDEFN